VAEQLGLDQGVGKRGAVDRDERLAGAAAQVVQRVGHKLLARPALSGDHHRRVAVSDRLHALDQVAHLGRVADQAFQGGRRPAQIRAGRLDLLVQGAERHQARELRGQLVDDDRLRQVVEGAFLQDRDGIRHGRVSRHQDHVGRRRLRAQAAEQREAVDARQADVGQHDVVGRAGDQRQRLGAVLRAGDGVALVAEGFGDQ